MSLPSGSGMRFTAESELMNYQIRGYNLLCSMNKDKKTMKFNS